MLMGRLIECSRLATAAIGNIPTSRAACSRGQGAALHSPAAPPTALPALKGRPRLPHLRRGFGEDVCRDVVAALRLAEHALHVVAGDAKPPAGGRRAKHMGSMGGCCEPWRAGGWGVCPGNNPAACWCYASAWMPPPGRTSRSPLTAPKCSAQARAEYSEFCALEQPAHKHNCCRNTLACGCR